MKIKRTGKKLTNIKLTPPKREKVKKMMIMITKFLIIAFCSTDQCLFVKLPLVAPYFYSRGMI